MLLYKKTIHKIPLTVFGKEWTEDVSVMKMAQTGVKPLEPEISLQKFSPYFLQENHTRGFRKPCLGMGEEAAIQCNLLQNDRGVCLIACYG